ncbi:sigma 54-interacting transcriptional regulator [Butyrivibrio proteoclasticus]|uniref:sigma 54-interacting transcriptional regulator n=1 Tax=Butyrivibrio proteoclasticus TaxID=43305 RepID=UPI00047A0219|nr:sigma 54-interacting transcriptional regulator [Butyrivibrio proteoclasticus]
MNSTIRNTGLLYLGQPGQNLLAMAEEKAASILDTSVSSLASHPDYMYVGLDDGEKTLGVDKAATIIQKASVCSAVADTKVIVIDNIEKMTVDAQNKLLKTLEESDVTIIGLAYEDKLLPTVKSRMIVSRIPSSKIIPADVQNIFNLVADVLNGGAPEGILKVLNMVAEKGNDSFFMSHREYVGSFIDFVGTIVITKQLSVNKDYANLLDVIYSHRERCSSPNYTKDDFFILIVNIVEQI